MSVLVKCSTNAWTSQNQIIYDQHQIPLTRNPSANASALSDVHLHLYFILSYDHLTKALLSRINTNEILRTYPVYSRS